MAKKIYKSRKRMLFGVCGGIAEYFNWDVTIVRLITLLLTILTKFWVMIFIYLGCGLIFPERHLDDDASCWQFADEDLKSANIDGEKVHKNSDGASGTSGKGGAEKDDDADVREAENARKFAEHADKLRTDSEFDSFFKK